MHDQAFSRRKLLSTWPYFLRKFQISITTRHLSVMASSTIFTNHSSSVFPTRTIWRNRICIGCLFHGWLFKDWAIDYHDSGAFRTGLGVVTDSSINTMTTMTPSICIFNQFKYRRIPTCRIIGCPHGTSSSLQYNWISITNWATGIWGKITGLSKFQMERLLWQQISTFHTHFLPDISKGHLPSLDDICPLFSAIGCLWTRTQAKYNSSSSYCSSS